MTKPTKLHCLSIWAVRIIVANTTSKLLTEIGGEAVAAVAVQKMNCNSWKRVSVAELIRADLNI